MPRPRHEPDSAATDALAVEPAAPDGPKGRHISDVLAALVLQSRDGALLPSERVLAERFGVARMTVRGALGELENQGLVHRVAGRGTFVRQPALTHSDIFRSFSEEMRIRGLTPGARSFRARTRPAARAVAARLGIEPGAPVHAIERVRTADGVPMALERTNLSADRFPDLLAALGRDDYLYDLLASRIGVRLESAEQTVAIARLTAAQARRLEVAEQDPAFLIERAALDSMGHVIEFGRSLYRGDRYSVRMHVGSPSGR